MPVDWEEKEVLLVWPWRMVLKKEPIFGDLYSVSVGPFIWVFTRV